MKVVVSVIFVVVATLSGDTSGSQDGSYKKGQGGFAFQNSQKSIAYNDTGGSYSIVETSGNYKVNTQGGEFPLNGNGAVSPDFSAQGGNVGGNGVGGNLASGHGHPHIPRSDPNWGVQHFHFPNGAHPFQDIFRQMSNPVMNHPQMPMPYPQMNMPQQMPTPYSQLNQPNQMPYPQMNQPQQIQHSQSNQSPQKPASESFTHKPPKQQKKAWTVDSNEDESKEAPTEGRLG